MAARPTGPYAKNARTHSDHQLSQIAGSIAELGFVNPILDHPTRNKDWSASYGNTWDDSSQGAELYDGFITAAIAEAIEENTAWYCWHASRRRRC